MKKLISYRLHRFCRLYSTLNESSVEKNYEFVNESKCRSNKVFNHNELAKDLSENVIYQEKGLIAINKPYGLKKEPFKEKAVIHASSVAASSFHHLSFVEALPYISIRLNVDNLRLVKLPERYISGVSLLATDDKAEKKIASCFRDNTLSLFTYLAICNGIPPQLENSSKLGITFVKKDNIKRPMIVEKYSKNMMKNHTVIPFIIRHRVLSTNEDMNVSLIQLTNNRNKWHGVRLYCATRLFSPIIGDFLMASRIKTIQNVPVLIDPFNPSVDTLPILPSKLLRALNVNQKSMKSLPLYLHLSQVDLPKFTSLGKSLIAKPPDNFLSVCEKLKLDIPKERLQNCNFNMNKFTAL